ncbi:MAG: threonine--tRNA ligase [Candidatus Microthrix sp.]|uniref:threonine--tRNA ligase n=1 Tax=Candidatus Neomicrothrix sp. TaxID=2719034 RepID=UPI001B6A8645|nr:threonine--tRNA ligase [Candidatus Microthrix sp.]MBP7996013.1 threonine--tRNA ligase [Candidatus Microthrix sp.]
MSAILVTLPDGSQRELDEGATGADLAADIGPGLAKAVLIAEVNGEPKDLGAPLPDGAQVRFLTKRDPEVLEHLRHSTAHVLAQAVLDLWPGATFAGGPPIEDGFYYDFELPGGGTFSEDDLVRIEKRMNQIIKSNQRFERYELPLDDAMAEMADHPYKQAFMSAASAGDDSDGDAAAGEAISFYRNGDGFIDMCRGPHVPSTGKLGWFKLMRVAGAYFRGSEANPMLQRIYGTAWTSKDDLGAHLERLEQAAARDHRRLGAELDLFSFPDEIGSGLAVFHPKGGIVRMLMEDYSRKRHAEAGYEFVNSPHITKENLFQTSGHLDWFADGMFPPMQLDLDGDGNATNYYLKPMNCPFHILIFRSRMRSYRELPLRMFEFGTVYRYEKSGVLHGLTRVRGLTMDDAHIFTTKENMAAELASLLDFVLSLLRDYGLDDFYLELSTRPEEKAVGTDEEWDEATEALREVAEGQGLDLVMDPGGGAFYGPKISVQARDAIGRTWQMSTIQVDFQLPQRFELEYVGSDGERHRPIMIHRALFGSVERFFGVLVEHYAGAFPTWLAPVQVAILPVADSHDDYAHALAARLKAAGYRSEVVEANDTLGKRIRNAKGQKLPYVLVVGDDDIAHDTVGVNPRGGSVERDVGVTEFIGRLSAEVESKGVPEAPGVAHQVIDHASSTAASPPDPL